MITRLRRAVFLSRVERLVDTWDRAVANDWYRMKVEIESLDPLVWTDLVSRVEAMIRLDPQASRMPRARRTKIGAFILTSTMVRLQDDGAPGLSRPLSVLALPIIAA